MSSIIIIFIVVAIITIAISMSISRFTNKTINNVMNQLPKLEGQDHPKRFYYAADFANADETKNTASDKDIIEVAVANNGKVTATILCAKLDISVADATAKLENLHTQGIFNLETTESGHLVYTLVDLDLMK